MISRVNVNAALTHWCVSRYPWCCDMFQHKRHFSGTMSSTRQKNMCTKCAPFTHKLTLNRRAFRQPSLTSRTIRCVYTSAAFLLFGVCRTLTSLASMCAMCVCALCAYHASIDLWRVSGRVAFTVTAAGALSARSATTAERQHKNNSLKQTNP